MNLFLATRRLTQAKEDHLTEFLAATLESDRTFQEAYSSLVLQPFAATRGWESPRIMAICTQRAYEGSGCRPDLVLTLADKHVIACEHKIDAAETMGPEGNEIEAAPQLERYLQLPINGLAYFRSSWSPPSAEVVQNPKYIRPERKEHFLWSDLYSTLRQGTTDLAGWLHEGFKHLGYTPPHPAIGDLADRDPQIRTENRKNFAKFWQATRSSLHGMGWKVESGSICELYLRQNERSAAELIFVTPNKDNGRVLLIRITPRDSQILPEIRNRLAKAVEGLGFPAEVENLLVSRKDGKRSVVDVAISLIELLAANATTDAIEQTLLAYVIPLVRAIEAE